MTSSLTIVLDTTVGKHFEITIEKTGDESALLRVQAWGSNQDHRREDPAKDDVIKLTEIHFDQVRRLLCKADMRGSFPSITCTLNDAAQGKQPYVRIVLADTFAGLADGLTDYAMEKADYDELKQFIINAKFPDLIPTVIKNERRGPPVAER
ncbi:MAG TPA: hypothetical protein VEQ35_05545 [Beijerinckia sp.]|nr:hypothetical protein [Beijerinckia sp.]